MPLNRNTLMRIRTIDACLCRRQRRWTLEDLRQACQDALLDYEGIGSISIRTIQRDIELMRSEKLGYCAPIVVTDRKYYTYDDPEYSITRLPLSPKDLAELSSAVDIIRHYQAFQGMDGAEDILARIQDKIHYQEAREQIVFIETNKQLKGLKFLAPLYDFILHKQPITIEYRSFRSARDSRFHVSPYLLKEYNNRWFLLAYSHKLKDIQTIALDRIISVAKDPDGIYRQNTFMKPRQYLDQMVGVTRGLHTRPKLVTIKADPDQAPYILTKPIHHSQQVIRLHDDGSITLQLNVIHNIELESRLLSYGHHIEVISPLELRHRIVQSALLTAAKYTPHK